MSEGERSRGVFRRPFDAIASVAVPVVADAVDPDELVDRIDVDALVGRIDIESVVERIDIDALVGRIDVDAVVGRIDVDTVVERIDVNAVVGRIDVDTVVDRIDVDAVVGRIDVDAVVDRIDIDALLARLDVDKLVARIDIEAVLDRIDVDALLDRIDVDRVVARIDVDAIARSLDIDAIVAESTKGVFGRFIDLLRRQLVGIDEITMRTVNRLLRRDYESLPAGPQQALERGAAAGDHQTMSGRYAGPVSRLGALGLDVFVMASSFALLWAGASYLFQVLTGSSSDGTSAGWVSAVAFVLYAFFYFWFSQALTGRTLSQALVGLKVVRTDGSPLTPGAAAIRTVVLPFSFLFFGLGALMALVDRRRRALQDVAAGSAVVYDWGDRPAALPAPLTRYLQKRSAPLADQAPAA